MASNLSLSSRPRGHVFPGMAEHGGHLLRGHVRLDVVAGREHKPAAATQGFDQVLDHFFDIFHAAEWHCSLGIRAAPEYEPGAVFFLEEWSRLISLSRGRRRAP